MLRRAFSLFGSADNRIINRSQLISMTKPSSQSNKSVVLLDVRQPDEFKAGTIPGSVNLPLDRLESQLADIEKDKTYVVFCQAGVRSMKAQILMQMAGFSNVLNYKGSY